MKHVKHNEAFYQKLGYLFYSVAAADGKVDTSEKEMLHKMVVEDWIPLEDSRDPYGTDNAYQIEILFDFLIERGFPGDPAFHVFEHFFKNNLEMFGDEVIDKIYHTSDKIASSLYGKNKAELIALTRIHLLLGKERHIL